ncbi:response regulator [Psychromonas aquimarina]|uniref:response regulator n=1 Tax=Psychromonas aquimarina TaxID=444919 RepID=UPI000404FBA2|nr:response regulator [Psychromonas aquimarina]
MNILIIEDEAAIADTLIHVLTLDGFQVEWVPTGTQGLAVLQQKPVDLLILDIGLPDINGLELCKTIRGFSDIPIIFLSARSEEIDRVVGLEIGGDDYMTKPFSPREMLARVKLRLKPRAYQAANTGNSSNAEQSALQISLSDFDFKWNGQYLGLTAIEFKILNKLFAHKQQVFSREQLLDACGIACDAGYQRNIDSHIKTLRQKLKQHAPDAELIKTKRGFGYYYQPYQVENL